MQQRETRRTKYNRELQDMSKDRTGVSDIHLTGVPKGEVGENVKN